jgi:DNA processing protein
VTVDDKTGLVGLAALPSMGPRRLQQILRHHSAGAAFELLASGARLAPEVETDRLRQLFAALRRQAADTDPARVVARCGELAISILARTDPGYPEALAIDPDPPEVLFVIGRLDTLSARRVAIVGTRNATAAGRATASELGAGLAEQGVAVVSGLARGIDGAAHRGVRSAGGRAVAAVGNGLDRPYPKQNTDIWQWVAGHGVVMSEWPPGTPPDAWRFPYRNRLIAALCEVLVVVESRASGGSLITARLADDRGATVMAVPGSTRSRASEGTNKLISEGAELVASVDDVMVALGLDHSRYLPPKPSEVGDALQQAVMALCVEAPSTVDTVAMRLGVTVIEAAVALAQLEEAGVIVDTDGWYEPTAPRLSGSKGGAA